ncbi:hypothetical protein EV359DRAFT_87724 [Lentinula novae-zelandiae]|nr:hypothetical protein EV359DRAFT_87724 [Lentinula novae-zelandiae]
MELNMLDDGDALDRDHQELSQFLDTQWQETVAASASKRKRTSSPVRSGGATSAEAPVKTSRKRHCHQSPRSLLPPVVPRMVCLVLPSRRSPPPQPPVVNTTPLPSPPHASAMDVDSDPLAGAGIQRLPVPSDHVGLVQGPTGLVRLAAVAEQRAGADRGPSSGIKGTSQDLLSSVMPPSHSRLVPCPHATHPYRVENERLSSRVRDLEAQLAESQLENSALTSALRDTSHLLEARQWEVEQLRTSQWEVMQQGLEYSQVLDQFHALERALPGRPEQSLVERLRDVQEELLSAREEKQVAEGRRSASARRNSELQASLVQNQGLVDESNTLAARQHHRIETLQEELVLEYLQALRGIHGELHVRTLSSLHWFFDNAANRDDGYAPSFETTLEPPLHRRMFALDAALPYHGAGRWEDIVPAFPSLDCFTRDWEELMVSYVHHLTDTALPEPPVPFSYVLLSSPYFSCSPPPFGSVAPLIIDLTGDDDDLYESSEEASMRLPSGFDVQEESL